jgi:hypothetical protein
VEPEVEVIRVERAVDDVVELLADEEPRDLLRIVGIDRADDERARAVGTDHLPCLVFDVLALPARLDQHVIAAIFQADEGRAVVNLRAAALDRPVIRELPVQVRRGATEKIHGERDQAGEMERHPAARGRLVQHLARQRAEILDQEAVAARREDAAADLVARNSLRSRITVSGPRPRCAWPPPRRPDSRPR